MLVKICCSYWRTGRKSWWRFTSLPWRAVVPRRRDWRIALRWQRWMRKWLRFVPETFLAVLLRQRDRSKLHREREKWKWQIRVNMSQIYVFNWSNDLFPLTYWIMSLLLKSFPSCPLIAIFPSERIFHQLSRIIIIRGLGFPFLVKTNQTSFFIIVVFLNKKRR